MHGNHPVFTVNEHQIKRITHETGVNGIALFKNQCIKFAADKTSADHSRKTDQRVPGIK